VNSVLRLTFTMHGDRGQSCPSDVQICAEAGVALTVTVSLTPQVTILQLDDLCSPEMRIETREQAIAFGKHLVQAKWGHESRGFNTSEIQAAALPRMATTSLRPWVAAGT
jgi:hypothetical protein